MESDSTPLYLVKEEDREKKIRVQKFEEDDTWDTYRNETLVENFDSSEEAKEKAEEVKKQF